MHEQVNRAHLNYPTKFRGIQFFKIASPLYWLLRQAHKFYLQRRLPAHAGKWIPHIVVGALRAGGSGKTGTVIALTRWFQKRGLRVGILAYWINGYDKKKKWKTASNDWKTSSDEAVLMARKTGADVYVTRNRHVLWKSLSQSGDYDIILSDDGFQDPRLKGACKLVLKGTDENPGLWDLLPGGAFRETRSALNNADFVLEGPVLQSRSVDRVLEKNRFYRRLSFPSGFDKKKPCVVFCALGHNEHFMDELRSSGINVLNAVTRRDHTPFSAAEVQKAAKQFPGCQVLLTEKDAVKLKAPGLPLWVVAEEIILSPDFLDELILNWDFGNFF